ncbi:MULTISPECIES: hypothetical protein [unclassified Frankia]
MTEPKDRPGGHKTLAVKLPNALHAQLELIVRVDGSTMGAALLAAAEFYVEAKRSAPDFAEKAQAVIAEAEAQAAAARQAVEALLLPGTPGGPEKPGSRSK